MLFKNLGKNKMGGKLSIRRITPSTQNTIEEYKAMNDEKSVVLSRSDPSSVSSKTAKIHSDLTISNALEISDSRCTTQDNDLISYQFGTTCSKGAVSNDKDNIQEKEVFLIYKDNDSSNQCFIEVGQTVE